MLLYLFYFNLKSNYIEFMMVKRNESMQKLDYQEIETGDGLNWFLLCSINSSLRGKETDDR